MASLLLYPVGIPVLVYAVWGLALLFVQPKQFVEIFGSHNDGFLHLGDVYKDAWVRWLDSVKQCRSEIAVREAS
jgi:hypothetical protein